MPILYLPYTYPVPLPCPCHAQTTQAQDNFPFVYDTLPTAAFTETVQIHRRPYILCLSCALLMPILCHTAHRQAHRPAVPIPHSPADHSPPCLTKLSPNTANILAASHDRTTQHTAETQTRTTLPLHFTFILCLSYAFLVFTLCHGIQFHLLQLNRYVAANISCVYPVLIMCLPCAYPVSLSAGKVICRKYSI